MAILPHRSGAARLVMKVSCSGGARGAVAAVMTMVGMLWSSVPSEYLGRRSLAGASRVGGGSSPVSTDSNGSRYTPERRMQVN